MDSGLSSANPLHLLGHSVWLSAVDPKYLTGPSIYGPGAVDLSAVFARFSGGHPWIAVAWWRCAVVGALALCCWGVTRLASARGANPAEAVIAGVANPGVLIIFVAGIHNDALMIALVVAGIALAMTKRPWWAVGVAALAVTVKAPALLAVLAVAWWCWNGLWQRRARALIAALILTVGLLALTGIGSGGGFTWLRSASLGTVASSFSVLPAGVSSSASANMVQLAGILAAIVLVLSVSHGRNWVGVLAVGFALMALCAANPQPWYLLWALPVVACTLSDDGGVERATILVLCVMTAWSELPLGVLLWFAGIIGLVAMGVRWWWSRQGFDRLPHRADLTLR